MVDLLGRKYKFNNWVHGCLSDGHLILLDTKNDRYLFVDRGELSSVLPYIEQHLAKVPPEHCQMKARDLSKKIINQLLREEIITTEDAYSHVIVQCIIDKPVTPFEHIETDNEPKILWHHVILAAIAGLTAHIILRLLPLSKIIGISRQLNSHYYFSDCKLEKIFHIARIYRRLRPILVRSRICLYDSLAFWLYAVFYGYRPNIIFGVTGDPFDAHCWVQAGGYILNDVPQNIRRYTPIIII